MIKQYEIKSAIDFLQLETVFGESIIDDALKEFPGVDVISWRIRGAQVEEGKVVLNVSVTVEQDEKPEPVEIKIVGIQTPFGTITGDNQ